jgi:hypothetical protein
MVMAGRRSLSAKERDATNLPPVASKAKDYTERPEEVTDELDDLRTRGIAKVLNKHFTDTTKQLAKEKAQADAALADLERRRAQTKEFVPSKGGELNPYDKLYLQLQQKRAECRRKEKETVMLYQRYVMKYGKSAKATAEKENAEAAKPVALGTLDENVESNFGDKTPKKTGGMSKELDVKKKQQEEEAKVNHFMSALTKFMTDEQIHEDAREKEKQAIASKPSKLLHGGDKEATKDPSTLEHLPSQTVPPSPAPEVKNFMSAVSNFMAPPIEPNKQDNVMDSEKEMKDEPKNGALDTPLVEATENASSAEDGVDFKEMNALVYEMEASDLNESDVIAETSPEVSPEKSTTSRKDKWDPKVHKDCSSPTKSDTCPKALDFKILAKGSLPPTTPEQVTKEDTTLSTPTACTTPTDDAQHINLEAPSFATTTVDEDVDERSIISGLTSVNSALTRQVLDEIEEEMEAFIKTETAAIRQMLDTEEEYSTSHHGSFVNSSSSLLGDESVRVAMKAEAMAREMQRILNEFANEDSSAPGSVGGVGVEAQEDDNVATKTYPHKFQPPVPGEEWYVYFDENYQREFYVDKKSNRTQWDYPTSVPTPRMEQQISSDEFLSDMQSVASSRGTSISRRSSRRSLYRRQRRKRRMQRLVVSFFTLFCVLVAVFHWRVNYPDKTFRGAMSATLSNIDARGALAYIKDQYEYTFTDRRKREEEEEKAKIFAKAQRERQARELAARKAKEEAVRKAKEEAQRKAKKEAERKLEAERQARIKAALEEEAHLEAEGAAAVAQENEQNKRRPWGCNIPFAYIVPRCNRLAKAEPVFRELDLVFLQ